MTNLLHLTRGLGLVLCLLALCFPRPLKAQETFKIFSGEPRLIVVHGYSTSVHWPHIFKRKLDRYLGGEHQIEVVRANRGGTPIARWIDVKTGDRLKPWKKIITPALAKKGNRPAIVLAQQSLQWVYGGRADGIRSPQDIERIKQGTDAIRAYVQNLFEDSADRVFVAMHIYKHPMEPAIGHERLSLAALLQENIPNLYAGPDVWEATRKHHPNAFDIDGQHPGSIGIEIMAQHWFETLLKHDGLPVPEWSRKEMEAAVASAPNSLLVLLYKNELPQGSNFFQSRRWKRALESYDTDGDGKLTVEEADHMEKEDRRRILAHGQSD